MMATDEQIKARAGYENVPLFTTSTEHNGIATPMYVYVDNRENIWEITWDSDSESWSARASTANGKTTYGDPAGALAYFGDSSKLMVQAIEDAAERYRVASKPKGDNGLLMLLLVVGLVWAADKKGKR